MSDVKRNRWTDEEVQILKDNYKQCKDIELAELIPRHSALSIASKREDLGLDISYKYNRYSYEDFVKLAEERGFTVISTKDEYKNSVSKMRYLCPKHGEQITSMSRLVAGKGCNLCGNERMSAKNQVDFNIEEDKTICELQDYTYIQTKRAPNKSGKRLIYIEFICNKHKDIGIQMSLKRDLKKGSLCCSQCHKIKQSKNKLLSQEDIDKRLKEANPNVKLLDNYIGGTKLHHFQCLKCGNIWESSIYTLDFRPHCPCCENYSYKGEQILENIFTDNNIEYEFQKRFEDCKDQRCLPFDFYLSSYNLCIEYQGLQHFQPVDYFGGAEAFIIRQKHDQIKRDYCKSNGTTLIEIPYTYNTREKIEDFLKDKIIQKEV